MGKRKPPPVFPDHPDDCTNCVLAGGATRGVPGAGPTPCWIAFVAEGPGSKEDIDGIPMVGRSGIRFNGLLQLADLERRGVYVTNLVRHRPPGNRKPLVSEIKMCSHYLARELAEVDPAVVVTLGAAAANFFDPTVNLAKDHGCGRVIEYQGHSLIMVPMYHPAATLRDPKKLTATIEDFKRLKAQIKLGGVPEPTPTYEHLNDMDAARIAIGFQEIAYDIETTTPSRGTSGRGLDIQALKAIGYSIAWAPGYAGYVDAPPDMIRWALESPLVQIDCHRCQFEYGSAKRAGITITYMFDTKLAAYLLGRPETHLKGLTRQLLGRNPTTFEDMVKAHGPDPDTWPIDEIVQYGAADSDNTLMLRPILERALRKANLWDLFESVEMPLIPVLSDIEDTGVLVDEPLTHQLVVDLNGEVLAAQSNCVFEGLPTTVSVGSPKQLAEWFEVMDAPIRKRTETGLMVTDKRMLVDLKTVEYIAGGHAGSDPEDIVVGFMPDLMDAILKYRFYVKLRGYVRSFLSLLGGDGRLHPSVNQAGWIEENTDDGRAAPETGRLSYSYPNLQQVPHHGVDLAWQKRVRDCILAGPDRVLVEGDISQQEPRITALVTGDRQLLKDFETGTSIYALVGQDVYGRMISKADPTEWHTMKQGFLATCYGGHAGTLMQRVGMSLPDARKVINTIKARWPGLAHMAPEVEAFLLKHGYVVDMFGRRRLFPMIFSVNKRDREEAIRQAVNFKIQGPGGTIIKKCLYKVHYALKGFCNLTSRSPDIYAQIILTVHDSITVECGDDSLTVAFVRRTLESMTVGLIDIELPVEVHVGRRWGDFEGD